MIQSQENARTDRMEEQYNWWKDRQTHFTGPFPLVLGIQKVQLQ